MVITGLDESCYTEIWQAPEGNDYASQFRRRDEREWSFTDFALSKKTALNWFSEATQHASPGAEYRVVRLSRYPPCSVVQVISYYREKHD